MSTFWNPVISKYQIQIPILQSLLLANLILTFSLILVQNSQGKIKFLLWLVPFGVLGSMILNDGGVFSILFFQTLLFLLLLRKTSWLDELSKFECWIYLFVLVLLFQGAVFLNPFQELKTQPFNRGLVWYTLPYYLFLVFKMYLLAILVKIPVVLVYNHAQLSRKLRISSLFQSTVPQVIHLVMLLVIFYLFIAVWKAENVRQAFIQQIEEIKSGTAPKSLTCYKVKIDSTSIILPTSGYQPINYSSPLPELGIMTLTLDMTDKLSVPGKDDYFYFFRPLDSEPDSVYFVEFNSKFLKLLNQKTSIVTATKLVAHPYALGQWESFLFNSKILVDDSTIRLFPFGLISQNRENSNSIEVETGPKTGSATHDKDSHITETNGSLKNSDNYEFVLGRVFIPNYNANFTQIGFFTMDVLLIPNFALFTSPIVRYLVLFIVVYLLLNLLVIRRVVRFGSQINRKIVHKFNQLKTGIQEISTGNLDYKVSVEGADEFVELAEHFNQMGEKLKKTIEDVREKERLEHELNIARQVQLSLLPSHLPKVQGFQIAATLKTATEVGGDFYDMIPLKNNKFLFTIGDVSGKSTSAAFYMAQCVSLIRYSPKFTHEPREIILRMNEYFANPDVDRRIFVTAIVGMLDADKNTIRLVRAGHTQPILLPGRKKEEIRELQTTGLGIGLSKSGEALEKVLKVEEIPFRSGDMVIFYTDGVVEAARPSDPANNGGNDEAKQFYGEERLMELLNDLRGKNAASVMQELTNDVENFYGGKPPVDDYTLLIIQKTARA